MTKGALPRDLLKRAKIAIARDFAMQLAWLVEFYFIHEAFILMYITIARVRPFLAIRLRHLSGVVSMPNAQLIF